MLGAGTVSQGFETINKIHRDLPLFDLENPTGIWWDLAGHESWRMFSRANPDTVYSGVRVPGSIQGNLVDQGVMEDPYYRFNDAVTPTVLAEGWTYQIDGLVVPEDQFVNATRALLVFEGLDTYARVLFSISGDDSWFELGRADNYFRQWAWELGPWALGGETFSVRVEFQDPAQVVQDLAAQVGYDIPETESDWIRGAMKHRNMVRKPGYDAGWDWGPAFVPSGVVGSVGVYGIEDFALGVPYIRQRGLGDDTEDGNNHEVCVRVEMALGNVNDLVLDLDWFLYLEESRLIMDTELTSTAIDGSLVAWDACASVKVAYGSGSYTTDTFDAWWPHSMRSNMADRCDWKVEVIGFTATGYRGKASVSGKIGLRDVQVDTKDGKFDFVINGERLVFAKGSNVIPVSSFPHDAGKESYQWLVDRAVQGNQNMLRVWGGGYYMPREFYEAADEAGVLVWQEAMLACAMYPANKHFLDNVREEIREHATRLSSFASIAIWGGNNENEAALNWFKETRDHRESFIADYVALYLGTIHHELVSVLKEPRPFVHSSPSNGIRGMDAETISPVWGSVSDGSRQDVHFYDYINDCLDEDHYPKARFVSEYGYQSWPSTRAWARAASDDEEGDWSIDGELPEWRQHHDDGKEQMLKTIERQTGLPMRGTDRQRFIAMMYLSQVSQARCLRSQTESHLRNAGRESIATAGALFWQLNDVWAAPTWSVLDAEWEAKLSFYAMQAAFAPRALSFAPRATGLEHEIEVWMFVDPRVAEEESVVEVEVTMRSVQAGSVLFRDTRSVPELVAGSQLVASVDLPVILDTTYECSLEQTWLEARVVVDGVVSEAGSGEHWFGKLSNAGPITIGEHEEVFTVVESSARHVVGEVHCDSEIAMCPFIRLSAPTRGLWSANGFHLGQDEVRRVEFWSDEEIENVEAWTEQVELLSVVSALRG